MEKYCTKRCPCSIRVFSKNKITFTFKEIYSYPDNSNVTSSPMSTNGAQYLTTPNSSDSLMQFIAWFKASLTFFLSQEVDRNFS